MKRYLLPAAAALLLGAPAASADEILDYTGNNYTICHNAPGCTADHMSGTFTLSLSGSALDNLTEFVIPASDVLSFSLSDGLGHALTNTDPGSLFIRISTDSSGNVTNWLLLGTIFGPHDIDIVTQNPLEGDVADWSYSYLLYYAEIDNDPGHWTQFATDVPEPATFGLLASGFAGMMIFRRRRRKSQQPAAWRLATRYCGFSRLNMADSSS